MKIHWLIIDLFCALLFSCCHPTLVKVSPVQIGENGENEHFGFIQTGKTSAVLAETKMRDFRRLLDLSSPTVIDGAPENALIQPVFPDCLIYIKNKEGVIIDSEYILPNGDFFSRKWKGGKTADNRSVMLSIMKSNN